MTELISEDRDIGGAPTLTVNGREFVQETACSFKSVRAAQLIGEMIEKIDLGSILTRLAQAQEIDESVRRLVIQARDLSDEIAEMERKLASDRVRRKDKSFIEETIEKTRKLREDILVDAASQQEGTSLRFYKLAADVLPVVFEQAPEIVWKFCALMMVPNEDLFELSKKPNGISGRIEEEKNWLMFNTEHFEPLKIASFYLPAVGFDMLKKAGGELVETAMTILAPTEIAEATEEETEKTHDSIVSPTSPKSSSPNSESD